MSAPEGATAHALRANVEALERWLRDDAVCPVAPGRIHDFAVVQAAMPADKRNEVVLQDGWTHAFAFWCDATHRALISYGADGIADGDYSTLPEIPTAVDDFVVLDLELEAAPGAVLAAVQAGKQRSTVANIRSLGIVFDAYRIDNETFPGGPVQQLEPVEAVRRVTSPIYIRTFPPTDGWGHDFVYWTDGTTYRIVSPGRDGVFETDYTVQPGAGAFDPLDLDRDIVYANGRYEQWPEEPGVD